MIRMPRMRPKLLAIVVLAGIVLLAGSLWWAKSAGNGFTSAAAWRARLVMQKAGGRLTDLSWGEVIQMVRHRGGFSLETVANGSSSVEGGVSNGYAGTQDVAAGATLFHQRCAACHGADGSGGHGPALNRLGLRRGDSDFDLYRTIRDGVPGTAMVPSGLEFRERWQVVAFLRSLQIRQVDQAEQGKRPRVKVDAARVASAGSRSDEWVTYSGSPDGRRFSPLAQINASNVGHLRLLWTRQLDTDASRLQATPLVADGAMFVTAPPSSVFALDAATGNPRWTYRSDKDEEVKLCCGSHNRGVALLDERVFFSTLDGQLLALDANNGKLLWKTQIVDPGTGMTLTGAPLVAGSLVLTGVAGGEYPTRGFIAAHDPATGREVWRFDTIPGPGQAGHASWLNDAWKTGGGATWVTGSYDPSTRMVYWGVGNPNPDYNGEVRPGDNLFTNSVVALHVESGQLAWHFQFTPHDENDWDSAQTPVLADIKFNGTVRKVICWANRNGFYYVLDRTTGEYLLGKPYAELDWATGLDAKGRPITTPRRDPAQTRRPTRPGNSGASNWQNAAFDPNRGTIFVPAIESSGGFFTRAPQGAAADALGMRLGSSGATYGARPVVKAIDAATGERRWERDSPKTSEFSEFSGLLATGGGLVFGASGGQVFALESSSGNPLWSVALGGKTLGAPITFTLEGRQVLVLVAGRSVFCFGL